MSPAGDIDHLSVDTAPLFEAATGTASRMKLLWGDRLQVVEPGAERTRVRARGRENFGWVDNDALGGESLLELYFIDVGQGDGILIKTPGGRHLMIDGGYPRSSQNTGKSGADFVDWKFFKDYAMDEIVLDAMIASHCDWDHYGGLADILDVEQISQLDCQAVRAKALYHAGVGWWKEPGGGRYLGEFTTRGDERFLTQLVGDRAAVEAALAPGADPALQGQWAGFLALAVDSTWTDGTPTAIERLSSANSHLPEFGPNDAGEPEIKVLAPVHFEVEVEVEGEEVPAIRYFSGGDDKITNGNSLLLRLDYKRTRTLLTGDLNRRAHEALLRDYAGREEEFECDVGKACHHGSNDVSFAFLKAMEPAVAIISSGDNEGHDHPRPAVVAATAIAGHQSIAGDELKTPLVYSTELARSVSLGDPTSLDYVLPDGEPASLSGEPFDAGSIHYNEVSPGALRPEKGSREMGYTSIVSGLIYGLVNVRTDGEKILCATLDEKEHEWRIETTSSRF